MKSNSSTVVSRRAIRSLCLISVSFFAVNKATAQINNNSSAAAPPAVLLVEWTGEADAPIQNSTLPVRSLVRARIAVNPNVGSSPHAPLRASAGDAATYKFAGRFASLRPTALEAQAFALINEQRSLQHLQSLEWDLEMLYVAREHSENMARFNFFSHTGRDGKTADGRAKDIGVHDWNMIGENIAFNQGVKNNVEFAVQCWLYSSAHKENLLGKKWIRTGIGIAQTPEGKFYITQVFRN